MFENHEIDYLVNEFAIEGEVKRISEFGNGHINDTFLVTIENNEGNSYRIILQRMNKNVFHKPIELMENIVNEIMKTVAEVNEYLDEVESIQLGDEIIDLSESDKMLIDSGKDFVVSDLESYPLYFDLSLVEDEFCFDNN